MSKVDYASSIQYHNLNETEPDQGRVTVLYGDFGKRKTTTACSLIKQKGLLISSDKSWTVLKREIHKDLREKTTLVVFQGIKQLRHINYEDYDTVIIDTMGAIVEYYLDVMIDNGTWGGSKRDKLTIKGKMPDDIDTVEVAGQIDYRALRDKLRPVLTPILNLSVHKIFTFHQTTPIPGFGANQQKRPTCPAATFQVIGERADLIGMIEGDKSGRNPTINFNESAADFVGKSRIDGIQGKMTLDNFVKSYRAIVLGEEN